MADNLIQYNPISATCRFIGSCLYQVVGYADGNPAVQLSACQSQFGFPSITTVTLPVDPILTTATAATTYTDIFVSVSTSTSTVEETSTSFATAYETATAYSTTVINTLTTTVAAPVATVTAVKKRETNRRRTCKHQTSSAPPFPVATNCADLAAYSAACACLEPPVVTAYADAATSTVSETKPVTVTTTTETVTTVSVTSVLTDQETTTVISTLTTQTESATTATLTASPSPSVPRTFGLVVVDGLYAGKPVIITGASPAYTLTAASGQPLTQLDLSGPGTTPSLSVNSSFKMYVRLSTSSYGIVFFTTSAFISPSGYTWVPVTCSLSPSTLAISCSTMGNFILTRFLQCGATFYMANAAITPGGCIEVHMKAAS